MCKTTGYFFYLSFNSIEFLNTENSIFFVLANNLTLLCKRTKKVAAFNSGTYLGNKSQIDRWCPWNLILSHEGIYCIKTELSMSTQPSMPL